MCGIVGYIGTCQAAPVLLDGLSKLEYRGYDSAGIAVYDGNEIQMQKAMGRLKVLEEMTQNGATLPGTVGIGHTRWATHGAPSDLNAHPHFNKDHSIVVVHNGIIENYLKLKKKLMSKGYEFLSETDTEVIAHMLDYYYNGDPLATITKVMHRMEGSYALGILFRDHPDEVYAVRKDSPLIVGTSKSGNLIASDVPAVLKYTRDVYFLENEEIVKLTRDGLHFYNIDEEELEKEATHIDWDMNAAEKGGYEHFMLKEIMEEPEALRRAILPRIKDGTVGFDGLMLDSSRYDCIKIIACGSSYHVGMVGKYNLEKLTRMPVEVILASEFRYCSPIVNERTLAIIISQSGETLDTMAALREAKSLGARILSIVNVVGSSIARESDDVLYTWAGPEIAVASTKAYSVQCALLTLIAVDLALKRGKMGENDARALTETLLKKVPEAVGKVIGMSEEIKALADEFTDTEHLFYIGRGVDCDLCAEGSLKLKEISYIHSEAYASGELKHGTISLIEDGTLVIALGTYAPLFDKAMSNVVEVKARGADVLALTTESHRGEMAKTVENVITIPDTAQMLLPSLGVVPLQLFSYYVALQRGCDIDKPRNLAKSVTVE